MWTFVATDAMGFAGLLIRSEEHT
ncbi:MAG: hypothetical protein JWM82_1391, partial [Myxococcales bacterium]|nr:hypothetical protein [Myxococcales bacterium]